MELWLHVINTESEEELEMLQQTGIPVIQKAVMIIHEMSNDEKVRELARIREKALHDEVSALRGAERKGKEDMIKRMRLAGMPEDEIERIASIDLQEG